ncbi:helix-turn-helix domain-containing protein [Agarivorans sp. 1_MG-2023]|uniref:AraC family transcriptional regulator n=1 Tax=Agarivorans sp. 1_MG-2023 TaxID=3062634 RepID=UPI0026E13BFC|nr:helix-turn-helix domain-containing protein [Agarivorans sp. 1_MG-2023]MDO6763337.1 helix-turn-helix domain-containing protein [Agarivorans sp. 1_MG-2023]
MMRNGNAVLLLLDVKHPYDREILKGITHNISPLSRWMQPEVMTIAEANLVNLERFCGVIADFDKPGVPAFCENLSLPLVAISGSRLNLPSQTHLARVSPDSQGIVELIVQSFLAKGIRRVAFFSGVPTFTAPWVKERKIALAKIALQYRLELVELSVPDLTRPESRVGVVAASDTQARQFASLCHDQGISVPNDYTLIGIDADPTESALSPISLCSAVLPIQQIGEQAVAVLQEQIDGLAAREVLVPATEIISGDSADEAVPADPLITKALFFLNSNFHRRIKVEQVVDYCAVSRKTLETRFKQVLGKTVHQQLHQVRMEFAKQQLTSTSSPVDAIADAAGFSNQHYLYYLFRQEMEMTPNQYRQKFA